jgi:hypothetical protein
VLPSSTMTAQGGDADMEGGDGEMAAHSPAMPAMMEFTQHMMNDAEDQKILVPVVARLIAKLVEENDKVRPRCACSLQLLLEQLFLEQRVQNSVELAASDALTLV